MHELGSIETDHSFGASRGVGQRRAKGHEEDELTILIVSGRLANQPHYALDFVVSTVISKRPLVHWLSA